MQDRSRRKAVVANDTSARANDESARRAFQFVSTSPAFQPFVESSYAGLEHVQFVIGGKRFGGRDEVHIRGAPDHFSQAGLRARSLRSLGLFLGGADSSAIKALQRFSSSGKTRLSASVSSAAFRLVSSKNSVSVL